MTDLETILKLQRDYTTLKYDIKNVFLFAASLLEGKCDFYIPEPENPELCGIKDRIVAFSERLKNQKTSKTWKYNMNKDLQIRATDCAKTLLARQEGISIWRSDVFRLIKQAYAQGWVDCGTQCCNFKCSNRIPPSKFETEEEFFNGE